MKRDNSTAMAEQDAIVQAIADDTVIVEIRSSTALGASLIAFNQVAQAHGQDTHSPQEWVELELLNALTARKRAWEYTAKTNNNKQFVNEMVMIAKLFSVPASDHPKFQERMLARYDAEQACRAKYGVQ